MYSLPTHNQTLAERLVTRITVRVGLLFFLIGFCACSNLFFKRPSEGPVDPGGIPNRVNTCYMNSALQIVAKLYPDTFDGNTTPLGRAGKMIIDKIKDDKEGVTREEAQAFYDEYLKAASVDFGHQEGAQEDAFEALTVLLGWMRSAPGATLKRTFQYTDEQTGAFPEWINPPKHSPKTTKMAYLTVPPGSVSKTMEGLVHDYLHGDDEEHTFYEEEKIADTKKGEEVFEQLKKKYPKFNIKKLFKRDGAGKETSEIRKIEVKDNLKTVSYELADLDKLRNNILPIKLCRYAYSGAAGATKLATPVQKPFIFTLNTTSAGDSTIEYELVGFISHHGLSLGSGHYTACIKNKANEWIHYDDSTVKKLEGPPNMAQSAYVYFYKPTT